MVEIQYLQLELVDFSYQIHSIRLIFVVLKETFLHFGKRLRMLTGVKVDLDQSQRISFHIDRKAIFRSICQYPEGAWVDK